MRCALAGGPRSPAPAVWNLEGHLLSHNRERQGRDRTGRRSIGGSSISPLMLNLPPLPTQFQQQSQQRSSSQNNAPRSEGKFTNTKDTRGRSFSTPERSHRRSSSIPRSCARRSPTFRKIKPDNRCGPGVEVTYWDAQREVSIRIQLTRFQLLCVLVVLLAVVASLTSRETTVASLLKFASLWFQH